MSAPDFAATFASALLDPATPCPSGLTTWNGSDAAQRFGVYRNNVTVSLIDAVADTFPVVQQLVGEAFFRVMAGEFVRRSPPASPVLAWYGDMFAEFIAAFPPASGVPYLADVARLEYARVLAFHAADADPVPVAEVAGWLNDPDALPTLRLQLHPSLQVIDSSFAIVSLWGAHQGIVDLATVDPAQPECALVLRHGLSVEVMGIPATGGHFIAALQAGASLGGAVQQAASAPFDHAPFDPTPVLGILISRELLVGLGRHPEQQGEQS